MNKVTRTLLGVALVSAPLLATHGGSALGAAAAPAASPPRITGNHLPRPTAGDPRVTGRGHGRVGTHVDVCWANRHVLAFDDGTGTSLSPAHPPAPFLPPNPC